MLDPYRMVLINLFSFFLLTSSVLFYKFIFPKKKINLLILLILISFLPLISILRKGTYESGDLSIHVKLATAFFESISQGSIIPSISNMTCATYSCPTFIFLYLLPYYIISVFYMIGFTFIDSIKVLLIISFITSGVTMYYWAKEEFGEKTGFIAGLFYLFAPYHLVDLHFRVDIGEIISFAILPLNLLLVKKIINNSSQKLAILFAITLTLSIISHQVISLVSFFLIIIYGVFTWHNKNNHNIKGLLFFLYSILLGLFLSSFYYVPILIEREYIMWGVNPKTDLLEITDLLYSKWRFGLLFQGHNGELSFLIGYIQWFLIILSSILLYFWRKKLYKEKKILLFFLMMFFITVFMILSISRPLWEAIPLIKSFQFSYRLLVLVSFFTSVISAIIIKKINNNLFTITVCILLVLTTILNWGNRKTIPEINDNYLKNELLKGNPAVNILETPKWVDLNSAWVKNPPKQVLEVINGKAHIIQLKRTSIYHEYLIKVNDDALLKENTFYYPGWTLIVNNQPQEILYKNKSYTGIITFKLTKGIYKIELNFTDSPTRRISKIITIVTIVFIISSIVLNILQSFLPKFGPKPIHKHY